MTVTIMIEKAHRGNRQMCQKWNTKIAHLCESIQTHIWYRQRNGKENALVEGVNFLWIQIIEDKLHYFLLMCWTCLKYFKD